MSIGRGGGAMSAEPSTARLTPTGGSRRRRREQPDDAPPPSGGEVLVRITGALGAVMGYGCLVAFLCLISLQLYRWFRTGSGRISA